MLVKRGSVLLRYGAALCLLLFAACGTTGGSTGGGSGGGSKGGNQPDWVRNPYSQYNQQTHFAATGNGNSPQAAEKDALRRLVSIFGQSIQVDEKTYTLYQESVTNGTIANWSENISTDTTIATSTGMDTLIGAEMGDTWTDGKTHYAVAVLNKAKTAMTYTNMIHENQVVISKLVDNIPAAEKNSMEGFARYQFAAILADVNMSYGGVLSQVGVPPTALGLKPGNDYRLEAFNITKNIPVGIRVSNDRAGRIQGAFAKSLSDLGFSSGGNNARYVLIADVTTEPVDLPSNANKFTRITVIANLTDTRTNAVLVPFNYSSREGHSTQAEADNRAYSAAERQIAGEYKDALSEYLAQLLPKK